MATGQAVVTDAAGAAPVVVGDVVAAANAVAAATEPAGVCISDSTYQLVRGRFECESAGELRLRGTASALPYYVVHSISAARNRIDALDPAQLTPLIGRNREVELIKERWDLTCEGVRNVILIVADPGLGKSRLVRVLREHVTGSTDRGPAALDSVRLAAGGHAVLEWYCSPYHQGSPFYPVIDYFERIYHLRDESDSVRRLDILIQRLVEDGIDSPEDQSLIAAMCSIPTGGRLPPLTLSPDRQREKTQDALLKWLETRSASNSVLFVVEDLHWVDPSTESLLTQFVEQADDANILAVFTFRPEYEPPWKGKSAQTQIALNRLTKNQVTEMIRVQAGSDDVPQSVVDQIIERTDGVPLFVEEFMRLAGDHGSGFSLSGDTIPTTLQGLLLARLDRMASNREVAQLGAVLGRTFSYRVLQAASDLDEPSLRSELEKLVAAGLLFVKGSYPECSYTFKHALLQDAAYQSLVKKRRQQFHRCVAEALENRFPETCETQPELLARHFTDAGETQRGLSYWSKAAARARERSAYAEAISHLQCGLEVLNDLAEGAARDALELGLRLPLGSCYLATQGYGAADVETQIARSRELCERLGPEYPLFNVMMIDWALRFIRGKNKLSQSMCVELEALADARDDSCRTEAHWAWGCTLWWTGEFERSLYHLDKSASLYRLETAEVHAAFSQQNCGPLVTSYSALALWMLGRPESATARADSAFDFAISLKHPFTSCVTTWQVGLFYFLKGDFDKAIELADAAYEIATEQSFAFWTGLPISLKGAALASLGRPADAIPMLITGLHMIEATGCEMVHQICLAYLADAYWATGRRDEAKRALDRAFELTLRDDERYIESELYRRRALFLLDEFPGAVDAAEESLCKAREIARVQKAKFYELRAVMALSRLRTREQERRKAADELEPVMTSFVEGFDSPDMQIARALLSSLRDIN